MTRLIARALIATTAVLGLAPAGLAPVAMAATTSAQAFVNPTLVGLGQTATYTITVTNTGTSDIGTVYLRAPVSWTIPGCPAGTTLLLGGCVWTAGSSALAIHPGAQRAFPMTATSPSGAANRSGMFGVLVGPFGFIALPTTVAVAAPPGLTVTAYVFVLSDAVVASGPVTAGDACPAANNTGAAGSSVTIAVCGQNTASSAVTPTWVFSSLGGTFIGTPGTFGSASIPSHATNVVLATWTNTTLTATPGTDHTIVTRIGASGSQTSQLTIFAPYVIPKLGQTITFTSTAPSSAFVGGPTYTVTATASSGLPVIFTIDPIAAGVCSISGSTVSFIGAGTCIINANQPGDATYAAAPQVQQSFAVSAKQPQTISFTSVAPAAATVGGPTYNVTATATSGLPVTFTIDASAASVCSISGTTVSFIGVGTCVIDADQAGDATYQPAPQVQQSFGVGKGDQTITFTSIAPAAAQLGGPTYDVTATATSGLPVTFTIDASAASVCSISGFTVSFIGAGTCVIDANQAGDANWNAAPQAQQSFAVGKGDQTISFTSTAPAAATAGGATYNVTATATSGLPVTFAIDAAATSVCSISGSTVSFIGAGTCIIDADQAGDANYNAAPQVQQSFGVGKGDQTISFTSTAPAGATVGGPTYTVTATATSGLPVTFTIDAAASTVCSIAGSIVSFIGVGTCVINADQAGDASYNAAPQVQQSFSVGKGDQTISFTSTPPNPASVGGPTYNVTATATSGLPVTFGIDASATTVCSIAGSTVSFTAEGTCVINANQAGDANWNAAPQAQQSFPVVVPPPVAVDDGPDADYAATGGVPISMPTAKGVLVNDTLSGGAIASYGASTGSEQTTIGSATATAQGGSVSLNADGSFSYEPPAIPPAGGTDTFVYTLTNTTGSDTATVTIGITNQIIFVDAAAAAGGNGSLNHPFNALTQIPAGRNTGGVLFFFSGAYTRSDADGVTLKASEWLIGQGVALAGSLPFTLAIHSVALPAANTNPTISTTFAAGNAVVLNSGNTVRGLNAGAAPGMSILGSSFGTLAISTVSINNTSTGGALSLTTGAFGASSALASVIASPTGSQNGISLTTVTGSLTIGGGSVSANSSGHAFTVSGGSVSVTDSGGISQAGSGALLNVAGGHTGTLAFNTGTLSATGGTGLQFNNADGIYTLANGATLNGGDAAVDVTNGSGGTMTLNASPITNPSGTAFNVSGSSATVTDSGAISKTSAGLLIDIESNTGGLVSLSGNLSSTSSATGIKVASNSGGTYTFSGGTKTVSTGANAAVSLTSNTGATIDFTGGGLVVTTTSGAAFKATGGGTIDVTGSGNTIASTTGTALDVENTTIGSSNLTFESITANGGAHGIVLDTTGATGGLTVTGTGSATSGGTIQGIAGADLASNNCGAVSVAGGPAGVGVFMNATKSVSLSWMTFPGTFGNFGILGYAVNGFTLDNTSMTGTYGDNVNVDDDTVHFCGLTGSATISNSTISNGAESNLRVVNGSGTLNRLNITNDTFGLNQTNGGDGVLLEADGGTLNVTVQDSTFSGARGSPFQAVPQVGATMDLVFGQPGHGNTIHNTHSNIVAFAQDLNVAAGGTLTFDINSNHFDSASAVQAQGGVFINAANSTAVASGYFRNNSIGISGVANSGSSGNDPALDIESNGGGDLTIVVTNNQIYQFGSNGAGVLAQAGATGGNPVAFNVTFTNNTIAQPGTFAVSNNAQGFQLNNGTNSGENFTSCLGFSGNVLNGAGTGSGGDARFRQRFDTKVQMPGYTGPADGTASSPTVAGYIQGLNPTGPPSVTSVSSTAGGGGFFNTPGGASCPQPAF
jgi:hypothetical protein